MGLLVVDLLHNQPVLITMAVDGICRGYFPSAFCPSLVNSLDFALDLLLAGRKPVPAQNFLN